MYYHALAREILSVRNSRMQVGYNRMMSKMMKGEIFTLIYLKAHESSAHPKELSDEYMVSTARIAVILNHLEKDGYIERLPDSSDSRQTIIKLSEKGKEYIDSYRAELLSDVAAVLEKLGPQDAREYVRLQKRILQIMGEGQG